MDPSADSRRSAGLPTVIVLLRIHFISLRWAKWNCSFEETKLRTNTFVRRFHSRAIQWSDGSSRGGYARVKPGDGETCAGGLRGFCGELRRVFRSEINGEYPDLRLDSSNRRSRHR